LTKACDAIEDEIFAGRILAFDQRAARAFARLRARRKCHARQAARRHGCMVGSIASAHAMTLATRNVADFGDLDLAVINPFTVESAGQFICSLAGGLTGNPWQYTRLRKLL
jgi:predicted nucleic acid-binding protein